MSSSPPAISRTPSPPSSASTQKEDMATATLMAQPIDNGSLANAQNRQGEMPDPTNVLSAIRHFIDLNIRLDIFARIQARNHMPAPIRAAPSASVGQMS